MTQREFKRIILKHSHYDIMLDHVNHTLPKEACGILLGEAIENTALVLEIAPTRNISSSKDLFIADPEELCQILIQGESKGLEMIGIFHSHFTDSYPSNIDRMFMKLNPVVWVIFVLPSSEITRVSAYQSLNDKLRKIELELL